MEIQEILKTYWGYDQFRSLQEDIIRAVMAGKDTLALLPTGGGKSICFQVPVLAQEGIGIVVSPLVALMKDQVENLNRRGIKAVAIHAALSKRELDIALDNCVYGDIKFLYLSPERLNSDLVRERIKRMSVNLLAIDEAHCISQWGYDFRPSYLRIAELRECLPGVSVLALTASATSKVKQDIQEKLQFKPGAEVFQKSFARSNLHYIVLQEEHKMKRLLKIVQNTPGTGVVYVRNRKQTQLIAQFLNKHGYSADFYHAGVEHSLRSQKQEDWIRNKTRIIVATNAFGMGIDKPDVRFVVHLDLPDSLEAYYQEAGRAGRDEKQAYAVLLYSPNDKLELEQKYLQTFPSYDELITLYKNLGEHYRLAYGSGSGHSFDFDLPAFCNIYKLNPYKVLNALKILEKNLLITLSDEIFAPSRITVKAGQSELYAFQISHARLDPIVKTLLRSYTGLFDGYVNINEKDLAKRAEISVAQLLDAFKQMQAYELIDYIPMKSKPQLSFTGERLQERNIHIDRAYLRERKEVLVGKIKSVLNYAERADACRAQLISAYFGELDSAECGTCDYCRAKKLDVKHSEQFALISEKMLLEVQKEALSLPGLTEKLKPYSEKMIIQALQHHLDEGHIQFNDKNEVILRNR